MNDIQIYENFFDNDTLRKSFNELAINTFGLDFESWYQNGDFHNKYIPFACVKENQVIANISVNLFMLCINGETVPALQFGTVMTDKSYRNQGDARRLMEHILHKYENEYDFMFLYANHTVLNFYPKFSFRRFQEHQYQIDASLVAAKQAELRLLNMENAEDKALVLKACKNRKPVSTVIGVLNDDWPLHFYALSDDWEHYYLADEEIVVLAKREKNILHIYDILTPNDFTPDSVLEKLVSKEDERIQLHFVPDKSKYPIIRTPISDPDNTLFIRTKKQYFNDFLFPETSHT
jgi:predicted N-acetyltransferase YhbS